MVERQEGHVMRILAVIDPESSFGKNCMFDAVTFAGLQDPAQLAGVDVVLVCPERMDEPGVERLMLWREQGRVPGWLMFGTYKGVYYVPRYRGLVDAYVVHSQSYRAESDALPVFVPLALTEHENKHDDGYIFVGGRKRRDFAMAAEALAKCRAVFVSDRLGSLPENSLHTIVPERIPLDDYRLLLARSSFAVVPLEPGDFPHGHSDVVRAIKSGRPVVVTRGASCDDYVEHEATGYLAEYSVEGFERGVKWVLSRLPSMKLRVQHELRFTFEHYHDVIRQWLEHHMEVVD
jgi:hypothetical protein